MNTNTRKEDEAMLTKHIAENYSSPQAGALVATFRGWNGDPAKQEWLRRTWPELHEALMDFTVHEMFTGLPNKNFDQFIEWVRDSAPEEEPE